MIKFGVWVVAVSYAPMLLQVIFGSADSNPIGLGLLTVFGSIVGGALVLFGVLLVLVRRRAL